MPTFELNQGENLLFQFNLLTMEDGLTWKGPYDNATTYTLGDVVTSSNVAYKYINVVDSSGHIPPNPIYWEVLPEIDADQIKEIQVNLIQDEVVNPDVFWKYKALRPSAPNIKLEDGLLTLELTKTDSRKLEGTYDIRFEISYKATEYIASGAQTDDVCIEDVINVTPC